MSEFKQFVCWDPNHARHLLATEALEGNEAEFLATHFPVAGFETHGRDGNEIEEKTEQAVLEALAKEDKRHAFCVVEGVPGSGKSHLIRWLKAMWPEYAVGRKQRDFVLLIQRADNSLEGTLRELREQLPARHQNLLEGTGNVQEMAPRGRARVLQSHLAQAMRLDYFEDSGSARPEDLNWTSEWEVDKILNHPVALEEWEACNDVVRVLAGAGGERNSQIRRFTLKDVAELGRLDQKMETGVGLDGAILLADLGDEAQLILGELEATESEAELEANLGSKIKNSVRVRDALNKRLNLAVRHLLGLSSEGLKEVFRRLRKALKDEARRLVLLVEDVSNFQGIDDQLIDALIQNAETRENNDLCDLISVIGITPYYYKEELETVGNIKERITHHIRLDREARRQQPQNVTFLEARHSQLRFAAKYLNASRLESKELEEWYTEGAEEAVPNACESCPFQEECHAAFGEIDGVGLYPFNKRAIPELYEHLEDPEGGMTVQTPRGMIQAVLSPTLTSAPAVKEGKYPSSDIDVAWLPQNRPVGPIAQFLNQRVDNAETKVRLERLVQWWGNRTAETTIVEDRPRFAGIDHAVFHAFDLPWLGDETGVSEPPKDEQENEEPPPEEDKPQQFEDEEPSSEDVTEDEPDTDKSPTHPVFDELQEIRSWLHGERLENASSWKNRLLTLLENLTWETLDITPWEREKLFTPNRVTLEGVVEHDSRHFVVPREAWVAEGLEACAALESDHRWKEHESNLYYRQLARVLRRLETEVAEHVDRHKPLDENGGVWNVSQTAVEVLLVEAWFQETVSPEATATDHWEAIWQPVPSKESPGEFRCKEWKEVLSTLENHTDSFRKLLKRRIQLTRNSSDFGVADLTEVAAGLRRFKRTLEFRPMPDVAPDLPRGLDVVTKLAEVALRTNKRTDRALLQEQNRLLDKAEHIENGRRGFSIGKYLREVDELVDEVLESFPQVANSANTWKQELTALKSDGYLKAAGPAAEALRFATEAHADDSALDIFGDGSIAEDKKPADEVETLIFTHNAPLEEIERVVQALFAAERVMNTLDEYISPVIHEYRTGGAEGGLGTLRQDGRDLKQKAEKFLDALEV